MTEKQLAIPVINKKPDVSIRVPGSKSITQRALITSSLANGSSILFNPLVSEDTLLLSDALNKLGIEVEKHPDKWVVHGKNGKINPYSENIYMGNNGTGIRFLCSLVSLGSGRYVLTGSKRMEERPIKPLLDALNQLGVKANSIKNNDCPPVEIITNGINGGPCELSASLSSQYLSSLMLVAPYAKSPLTIKLLGELTSKPYIKITTDVMKSFGIEVQEDGNSNTFHIPKGAYKPTEFIVEGDASGASYFFALAAITGGRIKVENLSPESPQGDVYFVNILEKMGCSVRKERDSITVVGSGQLNGIEIDMSNWPDVVPTLAAVASFSKGQTKIYNVAHLRIKETDRIRAVVNELKKIGVEVEELEDGLLINGSYHERYRGAVIDTYNDHRIAMAFSLMGLRIPDIIIDNPGCVIKSFPNYWDLFFSVMDSK